MPALPKLKKTKKVKEPVKPSFSPEKDDSITEIDVDGDFFVSIHRVRFSASVIQQTVMSVHDYSESERKLTWYDHEEKAEMNKKHDKIVRRYEAGKRCKRGMSYRGLDAWTEKGHTKFEETIERLLNAVMDEQEDQWLRDYSDPERIAKAAHLVSKRDVKHALRIAEEDEFEAIEAYKGDFKEEASEDDDHSTRHGRRSIFVEKKKQTRRRSSFAKQEKKPMKDGKKKRRSSKRKSSSKKKSDQ